MKGQSKIPRCKEMPHIEPSKFQTREKEMSVNHGQAINTTALCLKSRSCCLFTNGKLLLN